MDGKPDARYSVGGIPLTVSRVATNPAELAFRDALSAVIAKQMIELGLGCIYDVVKRTREVDGCPRFGSMTIYKTVNGQGRASAYLLHYIALGLGLTATGLVERAAKLLESGSKYQTARTLFKDVRPGGRGRKKGRLSDAQRRAANERARKKLKP